MVDRYHVFWQTAAASDGGDIEWFRPAPPDDVATKSALGMACFPLVPFSNRIRDGKFEFDGKTISLPLNFGDHPHAIHGQGWQSAWHVLEQSPSSLMINYRHPADLWPWSYTAFQRFELTPKALAVTITLRNDSASNMPVGLGLHPYFPRSTGCRIRASAHQIWTVDDEVMPVSRVALGEHNNPNTGIEVDKVSLDNGYTEWRQKAVMTWPANQARLTMTAEGPLKSLVIFTPPDEDFFCVEPVSHCTDAFNLTADGDDDTGMQILAPGQTITATVTFEPELDQS